MKRSRCSPISAFLTLFLWTFLHSQLNAQTFNVLYTFRGAPSDGDEPVGTMVRDAAGNLYGTTELGGAGRCGSADNPLSCGTVFVLNKSGQELGVFSFDGEDGIAPVAGLFRDSAGNLYGTAEQGGIKCTENAPLGCGTLFELNGTGTKIRHFSFSGYDGEGPASSLIEISGSLYGTTSSGGSAGFGTVYTINPQGKETVLYSFEAESDGCDPLGGVTDDSKGNLYGVTYAGGLGNCDFGSGSVYELDTGGNFTVLLTLGGSVGTYPASTLIFDSQGSLYGTAFAGGNSQGCGGDGCGTVFELSPRNDGTWSGSALYSFCSLAECADGAGPWGGLVLDASGNLYGTTDGGGAYGNGTVFKIDTGGNETVLHSFTGGSDGAAPLGGLVTDASGNLYGTTFKGGDTSCDSSQGGCGVVFEITP